MQTENAYTETDLGNIALNPRGEYSDEVSYEYLDTVSFAGGSYVCLAELTKTISGIVPEAGKNTQYWQMLTLPGQMTAEAVAMHDDVVNKSKQVEASRAAVELSQQEVEDAQADVRQMRQDTQEASEAAILSRDSAAGYAQSAEASRTAAKESEDNVNAQVAGFDTHVAEKTSVAESAVEEARKKAINAVTTQQDASVKIVTGEGTKQTKAVNDAGVKQVEEVENEGKSQIANVEKAGKTAIDAVAEQQGTSVKAVEDAGTAQVTAVESVGTTQVENVEEAGEQQNVILTEAAAQELIKLQEVAKQFSEDHEQIETNTALAKETKRRVDALFKLGEGITHQFEEDSEETYQKVVPTGAKLGSVKGVNGKTIVWNQLIDDLNNESFWEKNASYRKFKMIDDEACFDFTDINESQAYVQAISKEKSFPTYNTHKYYTRINIRCENISISHVSPSSKIGNSSSRIPYSNIVSFISSPEKDYEKAILGVTISIKDRKDGAKIYIKNPMCIDITKLFGAGNEPSTVKEFEAMFPADYYPYNEGELMSASVNEVIEQGRNLFSCYGFSAESITTKDAPRKISNSHGTTLSTIDYVDSIVVTQEKINNINIASSYTNGYFDIGINDLEYKKEYILSFDFTPTKMLIANVTELNILINGFRVFVAKNNFVLNKKSRITVKFTFVKSGEKQYIEIRNAGMSGFFENFQIEENKVATTYSPHYRNRYQIPQEILDLPGYGWSAGDTYNEVDWENKQYIQRVSSVDLGNLNWASTTVDNNILFLSNNLSQTKVGAETLCAGFKKQKGYIADAADNKYYYLNPSNIVFVDKSCTTLPDFKQAIQGVLFCYELPETIITDISDLIPEGFLENLEVESDGTLTFKNTNGDGYRIPVKNTEEYVVKLSEIASDTGGTE